MTLPDRAELDEVLPYVQREAAAYLAGLDERDARSPGASEAAEWFARELPEEGVGAMPALRELVEHGVEGLVHSSGPRSYHFVTGGVTPAAFGADWLVTTWDQIAFAWVSSPLAVELERVCVGWLKELFELPRHWAGVFTNGAQMANFSCLSAARQWWGERHGVDIAHKGFAGLPRVPVFASGLLHASDVKALGQLGIGRQSVELFVRDGAGRLDLAALERALIALDGAPAILIAVAGEPDSGLFDPVAEMAALAERYGAWLHVDGAFGLFARVTPRAAHLCPGVERADSVTVDGHKWLNVPYDCGFAFVRDPELLAASSRFTASYLPGDEDPRPMPANIAPESSRRARALPVWATLRAYGRDGLRAIVEGHLDLAQHLAHRVDEAPELERLCEVELNIVCFRYAPPGLGEDERDRVNTALAGAIQEDGRTYLGGTRFDGKAALRPALVNWRTRQCDVDRMLEVVLELGAKLAQSGS